MPKSVFVSHVFEDGSAVGRLRDWAGSGRLGPNVVVTGETADVRQKGDRAIREHLNPKVEGASAVVVLVGNDTHNHGWVDHEVREARKHNKAIVAVRLPGTRGAAPASLAGVPEVAFEPDAIRKALGS